MINKKILIATVGSVVVISSYVGYRVLSDRSLSPSQAVTHSYNGLDLKVVYCSPLKRNRLIFGELKEGALVPHGKFWRLGANEATEITLSKNVMVAGKPLKSGSYRLYAVPQDSIWRLPSRPASVRSGRSHAC